MIEYNGIEYDIHRSQWGGDVYGYLVDGRFTYLKPEGKRYKGYIFHTDGVICIYASQTPKWVFIAGTILILLALASRSQKVENHYYRASFAESPRYEDGILYCNVVNVSDRELTVWFKGEGGQTSTLTLLRPGESLACLGMDFIPNAIEYDQKYSFELEVQHD